MLKKLVHLPLMLCVHETLERNLYQGNHYAEEPNANV
jgi:hypothetical protein